MTKLNATIFVFTIALTISSASLFGQNSPRVAALPPIAPSMKGLPSVVHSDVSDISEVISGDLSPELEPLSMGDEVVGEEAVGEDYFQKDVNGSVEQPLSADRNRVFGINVLSMSRANFNDARLFEGGLTSGRITLEDTGGLELFMTNRYSQGQGWDCLLYTSPSPRDS